ncbi:MAG: DUF87 domain-containing protein [Candidatus Atabeyarchaeum deiterrae]
MLSLGRSDSSSIGDVQIPIEDLCMHLIDLGESGFGKTTLVTNLLAQIWDIDPAIPWLVFDLKGEYLRHLPFVHGIIVLKPGLKKTEVFRLQLPEDDGGGCVVRFMPLRVDILDTRGGGSSDGGIERVAGRVFNLLRECLASTFRENSDLSPLMERILWESLGRAYKGYRGSGGFFNLLLHEIEAYVDAHERGRSDIVRSGEALINRIERFRRGYLGEILNSDSAEGTFSSKMLSSQKVIIDLSECIPQGSTEDLRLLLNLIMERIFEEAVRSGLAEAHLVRHVTVIEDANILVPEVLHRRTMGDVTATEEMFLIARGYGEGFILVAQRPTLSAFTLSNAGTKVIFRTLGDSKKIGETLGLGEVAQQTVRNLKKFEALVMTVDGRQHKVSTAKPRPLRYRPLLIRQESPKPKQSVSASPASSSLPVSTFPAPTQDSSRLSASLSQSTPALLETALTIRGDCDASPKRERVDVDPIVKLDEIRGDDDGLGEEDVNRLLKRGLTSDKFKLFRVTASSSQSRISVLDAVDRVFGGRKWKCFDAIRSLTTKSAWNNLLISLVQNGTTLQLTEHGKKVWSVIQPLLTALKRRDEPSIKPHH